MSPMQKKKKKDQNFIIYEGYSKRFVSLRKKSTAKYFGCGNKTRKNSKLFS